MKLDFCSPRQAEVMIIGEILQCLLESFIGQGGQAVELPQARAVIFYQLKSSEALLFLRADLGGVQDQARDDGGPFLPWRWPPTAACLLSRSCCGACWPGAHRLVGDMHCLLTGYRAGAHGLNSFARSDLQTDDHAVDHFGEI